MRLRVVGTDLHILNMRARMPFRYGIASMTAVPHLFLRAELEIDGRRHVGVAADHLPPKWFTKDPASAFKDDVAEMLHVIRTACDIARAERPAATLFDLWREIYGHQSAWAGGWGIPPLLANFGVSLVERAVIDAFCRAENTTFARTLRQNRFGIQLGRLHEELEGLQPGDLLPAEPLRSIIVRHTVGLTDPLTDTEILPADRVDDGLPQSLEASIRAYGLTRFKIKLWGDAGRDLDRLRRVADVIVRTAGADYAFTLDGNENFKQVGPFRDLWASLAGDSALAAFLSRLIFVEQPVHRDAALNPQARGAFARWPDRPPIIIDESDAAIGSAAAALALGYAGTSHKNCKGVFKGVANACLIEHRRRKDPARRYVLSGEDLSNNAPVALLQDFAVLASLGVSHAERNGHHYFTGLTILPADVQAQMLRAHPDLYRQHERGFATLRIDGGRVGVGSVLDSPFGLGAKFDPTRFTPAADWSFESLGL